MWFNILKAKTLIPNARTRKAIDTYMETVEGQTTVADVKDAMMKKLGIFADVDKSKLLNYLMGWHHEKMIHYNENDKNYMDYRRGTGLD